MERVLDLYRYGMEAAEARPPVRRQYKPDERTPPAVRREETVIYDRGYSSAITLRGGQQVRQVLQLIDLDSWIWRLVLGCKLQMAIC